MQAEASGSKRKQKCTKTKTNTKTKTKTDTDTKNGSRHQSCQLSPDQPQDPPEDFLDRQVDRIGNDHKQTDQNQIQRHI